MVVDGCSLYRDMFVNNAAQVVMVGVAQSVGRLLFQVSNVSTQSRRAQRRTKLAMSSFLRGRMFLIDRGIAKGAAGNLATTRLWDNISGRKSQVEGRQSQRVTTRSRVLPARCVGSSTDSIVAAKRCACRSLVWLS
jgi:hypothetical protein